jgi:hypothetical protein
MINVEEVKKKILNILDEKGPSLPVRIAKETKLSPMFASAILAELTSAKEVKLSKLKVGSSPLYLLPGQDEKLEPFAEDNFRGAEKEAYLKLKEVKTLDDQAQPPAIRVALRSIRDFAVPIKHDDKIFWKYSFASESEVKESLPRGMARGSVVKKEIKREIKQELKQEVQPEVKQVEISVVTPVKKLAPIFSAPVSAKSEPKQGTKAKKATTNFLEQIREFLAPKNIQLLNTVEIEKKEITARVEIEGKQYLLVAYDKKRVNEKDIMSAYKKSSKLGLPYYILVRGEQTKKMNETINAYQNLLKVDKLE